MSRRTILSAAPALVAALSFPSGVSAMTSRPVRLATINLSFYAVTAAIVQRALEAMGHQVELADGPHDQMYPRVAAGEFDLFTAAWLPTGHGPLWRAHKASLTTIGTLYRNARFFLAVPNSLPADIRTIADLARPDVASRMNKTIQTIGPAAGISVLAARAVDHYALAPRGYAVRPGQPAEWRTAIERAFTDSPWTVMPLWMPLFANEQYDLRILDDPDAVFGMPDDAHLVAHVDALRTLPAETLGRLARIDLGVDTVSTLDQLLGQSGNTPLAVADRWVAENRNRFAQWVS
jgi:glycine betaine/proline transport system substrate-binding protein